MKPILSTRSSTQIFSDAIFRYNIKEELRKRPDLFCELPPQEYFAAMAAYASPQQYGVRIPKYIANKIGRLEVITDKSDVGDYKDIISNTTLEFKVSYSWCGVLNIVQIRLYEDIDYFLFCAINPLEHFDYTLFLLRKKEMTCEVESMGSVAHIGKKIIGMTENIEYRISLPYGSKSWYEWTDKYSVRNFTEIREYLNGSVE